MQADGFRAFKSVDVRSVFLTGATGILGAQVLKHLLQSFDLKIYCLVRADSAEAGFDRILGFLKHYDPDSRLTHRVKSQVVPICGDVSQAKLGLSEADFNFYQKNSDVVVHIAAVTSLFVRFNKVAPTNVLGTQNMIDFALGTRRQRFVYVSSYSVAGSKLLDTSHVITEQDFDIGQHFEDMAYQQSKFEAELRVRSAKGLKWNIVRPGQIFGESDTGAYPFGEANVMGLFYDIFKTVLETKKALYSTWWFDIVPVDYVAKGIVFLTLNDLCHEKTFLMTNPDARGYNEIIQMFRNEGYEIEDVSFETYRELTLADEIKVDGKIYKSPTMFAFKYWFTRPGFDFRRSASADCSWTRDFMRSHGIVCPKIDQTLISNYVRASQRAHYFPQIATARDADRFYPKQRFAGASL